MNIYEEDTGEHLIPYEPTRSRISVEVGAMVRLDKAVFKIVQILDFNTVIGIEVESGRSKALRVPELRAVDKTKVDGLYANHDISTISTDDWAVAQKRFSAIEPLIHDSVMPRENVAKRAKEVGISTATLYRWLNLYHSWGEKLALIPRKRGWREGATRLTAQQNLLIQEVINTYYLKDQRPTIQSTIAEIEHQAKAAGITPPGASAIRARISVIPEKTVLRRRGQADKANNKFTPSVGRFPEQGYPLQTIQIDHTPVDLIVVDDRHRKPIGRPWLTLAIDIHSRMITGYYLAMEAPSEISVSMCLAHSILPKEAWLDVHGVSGEWPVWGFPKVVHTDNGPDFKAASILQSCSNYNIDNVFRPKKTPKYGGHIETLLGSFMNCVHELPGTTFSNPGQRDGYDSEGKAVMTMGELEVWLVREILKYHQKYHSTIFMSPSRKWHLAFFGNVELDPLVSVPPRPADSLTVQLDFLPSDRRTVQHYGVQWDIFYYSDALRNWIGAKDPQTGKARKFTFRRDPRDISVMWFYDPIVKHYFKVPASYQAFPASSVWEFDAAKRRAVSEGRAHIDDHLIAQYINENRALVAEASKSTQKARRDAQRQRTYDKKGTPAQPFKPVAKTSQSPLPESDGLLLDDVDLIGEIL